MPPVFGTYTVTSNILGDLTTVDGDIYLWKNRCPLSESASVGAFNDADGSFGSDEITFNAGPTDTVWVGFLKNGVGTYTTTYAYLNSSESCNLPIQGTLTLGNSTGPLVSNIADPARFYKFVAPSDGAYTFGVNFPDATSGADIAIAVNRCPSLEGDFASTWSLSSGGNDARSINRQLTSGDVVYFYYTNVGTDGNALSLAINRTNTTIIPQRASSGFVCPNVNAESLIIGQTKVKNGVCDPSANDCTRFYQFVTPSTKTYDIDLVAQTGDSDLSVWIGSCPGINVGVNYKNAEAIGNDRISETIQGGTMVTIGVRPQTTNHTFSITAN
ncbi:hypothetical protein EHQ12_15310 [Leptospira gomenensis]|uniref:Uncharacterized protein n=1 Tax=Leptospira gomenensis TaxID=2484974 RepID=A0A5F1Y716_9LEPT|nr:hypothetical protein EHQ17_16485 [Leptospira gomenensis]TGK35434.1 hypothetical protein EHQ12_15310 [Leptospira gomenensis]TGK40760.1 hypothetical protein EHQ07_17830 [Leptospira gomenensis]TGK68481.1 hypothetical protein EHQ13_00225 [Leptospira gomenensis]